MPPELFLRAVLIGVGATLVMDLWALLLKRLFGVPSLDYAMVGRWLGHLPQGRLTHPGIARSAPVAGERAIGWIAHYAIGILFALLLLAIRGPAWAARPTLPPALIVGIATVAAPFLILQPGMGAGLAARKTPKPAVARLRSLMAHASFGVGLYLAGWAVAQALEA
ncbi:DUF2938 domain-containing protein [Achromobacter sp. SIMBA_011]|uniref:DUF2938 domain-containing protein n=1 Tax=Achromobacter sp. SIMBA_011 TaxID=3085759 RepID=UPI00397A4AC4